MCNPYDIANYGVSRQQPDHTAQTRSHGTNQVTRDKSGTKRDLQAPHGGPGYGVTVHLSKVSEIQKSNFSKISELYIRGEHTF